MNILKILANSKKVLGQNARNYEFVRNSDKLGIQIANDKIMTKELLIANDIPTPKLIGIIKNYNDLQTFDWNALPKSFVMKPVRGVQGVGIELLYNKDKDGNWITAEGTKRSLAYFKNLAGEILDGKYSIDGGTDQVFFEERIRTHEDLRNYTYKGAPDVRIVVYNKIPIMSYIRFPTQESKGKANMILGAVGTGIDIASGITTTSIYGKGNGGKGFPIEFVPGTKLRYQGLKVPYWNKILKYAVKAQIESKLKFIAIDFLIDNENGPVIVEFNARPGLSIQIVNQDGLRGRLKKTQDIKVKSIEHGIRIGKDLFGGEIEDEIERVSGKEVISNVMPVRIINEGKKINTLALIDTSRRTTVIDSATALEAGIVDRPIVEGEFLITSVKIKLGSQVIESDCRIIPSQFKGHKICIGRKDLTNYIIDVKKVEKEQEVNLRENIMSLNPKSNYEEMDEVIQEILKKLIVIPILNPINQDEEKEKFIKSNFEYNPVFEYSPIKFNPDTIIESLNKLNPPDDPIGNMYREKIEELEQTIYLIEAVGSDPDVFTNRSKKIFGSPDNTSIKAAQKILGMARSIGYFEKETSDLLDAKTIKSRIEAVIEELNLTNEVIIFESSQKSNKISVGKTTSRVKIPSKCKRSEDSLAGVIGHEVYTHVLRSNNSKSMEPGIFRFGSARYLRSEEGLATLCGHILMKNRLMVHPAILILLMNSALKSDFASVFRLVNKYLDDVDRSWNYALRVKRGIGDTSAKGAYTKDLYLKWAIDLGKHFVKNPANIAYALNGKAHPRDLKLYSKPRKTPDFLTIENIKSVLSANFIDL